MAIAPTDYRSAALDSLTLIYDRRSGQTHLLAPPLPEILTALGTDPVTATEVLMRLAARFDLDGTSSAASMIDERLHELAAMGLVARV